MSMKILIVDDSLTIRLTLRRILGILDAGVEVLEADSGETGLAQMRQHQPDLVLADLNMEGLSGVEMIKRMRQEEALRGTAVVVISSEADPSLLEELRQAGVQQSIRKPFDLAVIHDVLENEIARRLAPTHA
jgi:two-component system chemotaxis response regulator CheY